ncbi:Potassium voltage-gated channel protein Shaker [Hypsibius exemplaris]|uniref:Potassium voltage-gated channel protein Shaker n=1 Tax=Hypsibius exemplaris TaxID=2072580 RepID=A0A1W0X9E5_HYPEX|nr:Potassium voltage-gated channel protein Shaker [Hypsibius exemplaris]
MFTRSPSSRPPGGLLRFTIRKEQCYANGNSSNRDEIMALSRSMNKRSKTGVFRRRDPDEPRRTLDDLDPELGRLRCESPSDHANSNRASSTMCLLSPVCYDQDLQEIIKINIGGRRYETLVCSLNRFPHSLLGDPNRRRQFYNHATNEYFFDRNRFCFDTILEMYQTGEGLCRPQNVPIQTFVRELCFYDLGEDILQQFLDNEGMLKDEIVVPKNKVQKYIWTLFEQSDCCLAARAIAAVNVVMVLLAIGNFCIQTLPEYQTKDIYVNNTLTVNVDTYGDHTADNPFFVIETFCTTWFTIDLVVRFLASPIKRQFFLQLMNIIDVLSILPYFVDLSLSFTEGDHTNPLGPTKLLFLTTLRILRVIKIFRVFKLGRYSNGLQILALTMKAARYEVMLMLVVVAIGIVVFSAAVYYAELGNGTETEFDSIPAGFWWAIITWTTVGYGDIVPKSIAGKIIGGFCALCGILGLSFMVPVIVAHFEHFFYRAQDLERLDEVFEDIRENGTCPNLVKRLSDVYGPMASAAAAADAAAGNSGKIPNGKPVELTIINEQTSSTSPSC